MKSGVLGALKSLLRGKRLRKIVQEMRSRRRPGTETSEIDENTAKTFTATV
jgi:hypothetical protein